MRRALSLLVAAALSVTVAATAPSCSLFSRTAANAAEAADALRDAALALELLDALAIGYADGSVMPDPSELSALADVVESLKFAHDELAMARLEIKRARVFEAAEALSDALTHMEAAMVGLNKLGVDTDKARDALRQARYMLDHLRS
jgi:hypothetical protein